MLPYAEVINNSGKELNFPNVSQEQDILAYCIKYAEPLDKIEEYEIYKVDFDNAIYFYVIDMEEEKIIYVRGYAVKDLSGAALQQALKRVRKETQKRIEEFKKINDEVKEMQAIRENQFYRLDRTGKYTYGIYDKRKREYITTGLYYDTAMREWYKYYFRRYRLQEAAYCKQENFIRVKETQKKLIVQTIRNCEVVFETTVPCRHNFLTDVHLEGEFGVIPGQKYFRKDLKKKGLRWWDIPIKDVPDLVAEYGGDALSFAIFVAYKVWRML